MDGEEKKDEGAKTAGGQPGQAKSLDDLKAKLGLAMKPKAAEPAPGATAAATPGEAPKPAEPKRTTEADFAFTMNQPVAVPMGQVEESGLHAAGVKKRIPTTLIAGVVFGSVVLLVLGLWFGKIMKERNTENFKTKEAKYLLDYFTTQKTGQAGSEETALSVVEAHVEDSLAIYLALTKAPDDAARAKAEQGLLDYLKRTRTYREKRAVFSFEGAFPGVIYNQEIAAQVVAYIQNVQRLYDETLLMSLEADTLDRLGELGDTKEDLRIIWVNPDEKAGKFAKAHWIVRIDEENPQDGAFPVLPLGSEKGLLAPEKSLAKVDVGPLGKEKANNYKKAIFQRVQGRLNMIKQIAENINFQPLKDKLSKLSTRPDLFTMF